MKQNKPKAPKGYRMLIEGKDTNHQNDLAWMIAPDDLCWEWTASCKYFGKNHPSGNGKIYKEPKKASDWLVYRCRIKL